MVSGCGLGHAQQMTPSFHSKARHIKGEGWLWLCCCGGGSFGPRAVWIGTQLEINAKVNKLEVRLPVKKNQEILGALAHVMDGPGGMVRHHEVRRIVGKVSSVASFLPQLKPFGRQLCASLYTTTTGGKKEWADVVEIVPRATSRRISTTCVLSGASFWRFMQAQREEVLLVGMVIEEDHGTHNRMPLTAQFGLVRTKNCCIQGGETPLTKQHGKPSWLCWQFCILFPQC